MGLLQRFTGPKEQRQRLKEDRELRKKALKMDEEQLRQLPDKELFNALKARVHVGWENMEEIEFLNRLDGPKRIFFILFTFHREVHNGGLCQFFVNSSRNLAPYVSESMGTIGATQYAQIYDDFLSRHRIDPRNLLSFRIQDLSEYEYQAARYPFDDFDGAYYDQSQLRPMNDILLDYAKIHLEEF